MKKLFLIFIFLIHFICPSLNADEMNRYLYNLESTNCIYDLNSFEYNKTNNEFLIDVIYWFNYTGYEIIKSPYDIDDIQYLIFSVKYNKKTKNLDLKYKGFVSGRFGIVKNSALLFQNAKIYYDKNEKIFPKIDEYKNSLKAWFSSDDDKKCDYFIKDINYIFKNYKKGKLNTLKNAYPTLNR